MNFKNIIRLAGSIALPLIVGGIAGYLIKDDITNWYSTLNKPVFNPPNYVFGPVWTILYILMGISLYLILGSATGSQKTRAIQVFCLQLFLNFWWSILFFSFQRPDIAAAEIICLELCIIWMIVLFRQLNPLAAYLQVPYLLWVAFATVLNISVWILN